MVVDKLEIFVRNDPALMIFVLGMFVVVVVNGKGKSDRSSAESG